MRYRFTQTEPLEERLADEAKRLHEQAELLPHGVLRDVLMGVAPEALHLKIAIAGIEGVTEGRRWLCGPLEAEHARAFHAWQAKPSASFRASLARSARMRTVAPNRYSRDFIPSVNAGTCCRWQMVNC